MASWNRKQDSAAYETAELIISGIIPIFLIVIGTFGNLTCVIILLSKENRRASTNIYLIFLCLMDTISLYQWNLTQALYTFTNGTKQVWDGSVIMCKLSQFFSFYSLHTSAMFLTFVELDRACLLRSGWYKRKIARARVAFVLGFGYSTYDSNTGLQQTGVACYYSMDAGLNNFFGIQYPWVSMK
jgi:hypothetical protein